MVSHRLLTTLSLSTPSTSGVGPEVSVNVISGVGGAANETFGGKSVDCVQWASLLYRVSQADYHTYV